ncbi:MAG: GNAT family N-acetyltransferase [Nocardioidaceae bacterium]
MTTSLVRTRRATVDDVGAVLDLHNRCSARTLEQRFHMPLRRVSERLARQLVTPPGGWSVIAEQGEEIVGHGCAGLVSPGRVEVGLIVDDAFQGTGVGTRLMRDLADTASELGYEALLCSVEPDNESVLPTVRRAGLDGVTSYVDGIVEIEIPLPRVADCVRRTA